MLNGDYGLLHIRLILLQSSSQEPILLILLTGTRKGRAGKRVEWMREFPFVKKWKEKAKCSGKVRSLP